MACLQRTNREEYIFICFLPFNSGLDRASQTVSKGFIFSNHKYLTLLTLFNHILTIGIAKYSCLAYKGIEENCCSFLDRSEGYLSICAFMDKTANIPALFRSVLVLQNRS